MCHFTRKKWDSLPVVQQQKKLAELTRAIYIAMLEKREIEGKLDHYRELLEWSELPPISTIRPSELADRYHWHLRAAKQSLKEHNLLPAIETGDRKTRGSILPVSVYLDRIRSAHNVGSMIRTAEAFGLKEVLLAPGVATADHKQVRDASMGTWEWIPSRVVSDSSDLPGVVIAIDTAADAIPVWDFPFPEQCTLVMGNEEEGCSPELLRRADAIVSIPLTGRKHSLNVANAFAIVVAELMRQRKIWEDGKPDSVSHSEK